MRIPLSFLFLAALSGNAEAQYISLKDFPQTYGSFALRGDCTGLPRVTIARRGIRLETAAGSAVFAKPGVTLGYNGNEDHSTTFTMQGPGEGLTLSVDENHLWSDGGEHMGPAERAVDAAASGAAQLQRCGAQHAEAAPPPEPEAPKMRTTPGRSADEVLKLGVTTDPGFDRAYRKALGPLVSEDWPISMQGPGNSEIVTLRGARYLAVSTCKDHDCGDNALLVLYRPEDGTLFGLISVHRNRRSLGTVPPALVPGFRALWKKTWPAG